MNNSKLFSEEKLKEADRTLKHWLNEKPNNQEVLESALSSPNFSWRQRNARIPIDVWQAMATVSLFAQLAGESIEQEL
jgi:hypothetical protein